MVAYMQKKGYTFEAEYIQVKKRVVTTPTVSLQLSTSTIPA